MRRPLNNSTVLTLAAILLTTASAPAQRKELTPDELVDVTVTEHLDTQIPLDLTFVNSDGKPIKLADVFDGQRPVILTLNYSDCPQLCSLQLNGLFAGLQQVDWNLGDEYRMITASIDPTEAPQRAESTKQKYLDIYGRSDSGDGWYCLTGDEADIVRLAETVGFGYTYVPATGEYAHAAVTIVCTPDGRVSRYLYGIEYPEQTVRLALLEASEGKIGTTMDQVLMFCFQYDETAGRYGPSAMRLMQAGGVLTLVFLTGLLGLYWGREARKARKASKASKARKPHLQASYGAAGK